MPVAHAPAGLLWLRNLPAVPGRQRGHVPELGFLLHPHGAAAGRRQGLALTRLSCRPPSSIRGPSARAGGHRLLSLLPGFTCPSCC